MTATVTAARPVDEDRPPPHDLAAEQAVLGAILSPGSTAVAEVRQVLTAASFYLPKHGTVYEAALCLDDENKPTDIITVAAELERRGELARVGGAPYLHTLYASVPTAVNAGSYAEIVAEKATERIRREAAGRFQQDADNGVPLDIALDRFNERIADAQLGRPNRPAPGASWRPVDLGPFLDGTHRSVEPTLGIARSDGLRLLYPGKEHAIVSEMEAGKTWFELQCCVAEILDGNHVVWIDFEECEPAEHIERMLLLGAGAEDIREHWHFVPPAETLQSGYLDWLPSVNPVLAVLDGVNEGMNLLGAEIRDEKGAAQFRQRLIKPITALGTAVLAGDHVIKDKETRGRYALGSIHKGNAINGALFMLENAEPFGRGLRGRSHLYVTKDRPGHLRRSGRAEKKLAGKTYLGELVIDATEALDLTLWAPGRDQDDIEVFDPHAETDAVVLAAVRTVLANGLEATTRAVRAATPFGNTKVADALDRLVFAGHLIQTSGSNRSRIYSVPPDAGGSGGSGPKGPGTAGTTHAAVPAGSGTTGNHTEPLTETPR